VPRYQLELFGYVGAGNPGMTSAEVPPRLLLDFPATFLPVSFAGKRLLHPQLLAWLQVVGVSLDILDNVLLQDLSLEAAQGVFESFALLKLYFRQTKHTSQLNRSSRALLGDRDAVDRAYCGPKNSCASHRRY